MAEEGREASGGGSRVPDPRGKLVEFTTADGAGGGGEPQRSDLGDLSLAEETRDNWISQKEEVIATQDDATKKPTKEAQKKVHDERLFLAEKANDIYKAAKGSTDSAAAADLTKIARAYWTAAEEAEQIENIWTLRKKKNANKTLIGVSLPGKKHDQLNENLKEAIRWARLTPEERRAELTGEEDSYPEVDRLWKEAQEAWEDKEAATWALANQEAMLQEAAKNLEKQQQVLASKNLQKTREGKVSKRGQFRNLLILVP